jgi:hypothetical protein
MSEGECLADSVVKTCLTTSGDENQLRADVAERLALGRFEEYEAARIERERVAADEADIAEIERIGEELGER